MNKQESIQSMVRYYKNYSENRCKNIDRLSISKEEYFKLLDREPTRFTKSPFNYQNITTFIGGFFVCVIASILLFVSNIPWSFVIISMIFLGLAIFADVLFSDWKDKRYYQAADVFLYVSNTRYKSHKEYLEEEERKKKINEREDVYSSMYIELHSLYCYNRYEFLQNIFNNDIKIDISLIHLISPSMYYDIKTMILLAKEGKLEGFYLSEEQKMVDIKTICPI